MGLRTKFFLLAGLLSVIACFGVFVLPFLLPPAPVLGISVSNYAGFNNRVAVLSAAITSLVAFTVCLLSSRPLRTPKESDTAPMSRRFVLGWSLGVTLAIAVGFGLFYASLVRYLVDYGYFIEQMSKAADYHRRLYTEIEFPYGPLLFYPPVWLRHVFLNADRPLALGYIVTFILQEMIGFLSLAYLLQSLSLTLRLRRWFFISMLCFSFIPTLGLNVNYFRYATPPAILFFCLRGRTPRQAATWVVLGQIVCLGISPEMGFAFGAGVVFCVIVQAFAAEGGGLRKEWLLVSLLPLVGAAVFVFFAGKQYFLMVLLFSGGIFNLIVEPVPYILIFLLAVLWLAPNSVAASLRSANKEEAALLAGLYGMGLALLPVVFGRCDAAHVLLSGLPIFLAALSSLSVQSRRLQYGWITAFALVTLSGTAIDLHFIKFQGVFSDTLLRSAPLTIRRLALRIRQPADPLVAAMMTEDHPQAKTHDNFDTSELASLVGNSGVSTPFTIPPSVETYMKAQGIYRPGFYGFTQAVLDARAEKRQIAEMDEEPFALLPSASIPRFYEDVSTMSALTGIPLPYKNKRSPYVVGEMMAMELTRNWMPIGQIDGYTVYRRK